MDPFISPKIHVSTRYDKDKGVEICVQHPYIIYTLDPPMFYDVWRTRNSYLLHEIHNEFTYPYPALDTYPNILIFKFIKVWHLNTHLHSYLILISKSMYHRPITPLSIWTNWGEGRLTVSFSLLLGTSVHSLRVIWLSSPHCRHTCWSLLGWCGEQELSIWPKSYLIFNRQSKYLLS